ncbi:hypothetical protein AB0I28_32125 [Phytomonospora sp. NPDC050363]|uniref:hypothetical protein n=1 Tax=Phytomonospora sp. NPDC050363 TaxID=3155642 RepID=UPI0033E45692
MLENPRTWLALLALLGVRVGLALLAARFWPLLACKACRGSGKHFAPRLLGGFRRCRRCKGSGSRIRPGRRLLNMFVSSSD